jgi:hypothetical protein
MDANFKGNKGTALALLGLALFVCFISGRIFLAQWAEDKIVPAYGFEQKMLSDYFSGLKGNPMDTPVFVQKGNEEGGSVLILGGTHPNEPSGFMSAVLFFGESSCEKREAVYHSLWKYEWL